MSPLRVPQIFQWRAISASLPAWLPLALTLGHHGPNETFGSIVELPNLPGEIILMIMQHLEPPTLLSFSLTCHNCYQLALPQLSQVLLITPHTHAAYAKRLTSDSYLNQYVQRVQIGSRDTFDLGGDDFHLDVDFYETLSSLPSFRELIIRDADFSVGWEGVNTIGRALANKLHALQARIIVPLGISYALDVCRSLRNATSAYL